MKAVTFTDVIQFIIFGGLLPVLALAIWNNIHAPHQIVATPQNSSNFSLNHVVKWDSKFMETVALMFYVMMPSLPPELFQRMAMAMAKDIYQLKRSI